MKVKKRLILFLIFLLFAGEIIYFLLQDKSLDLEKFFKKGEKLPFTYKVRGVTLAGWHKGKKEWEIVAENIEVSKDKRINYFKKIKRGTFFYQDKKSLYFKADSAIFYAYSKQLEIKGNIKLWNKEGVSLETEEINYVASKNQLIIPREVRIRMKENSLRADKMVGDIKMESLMLEGNIIAKLQVEIVK